VVNRSAQPVQTVIENNPVYELRLMIYPVVLGAGRRVFGEPTDKKRLRLVDSKTVGDGIVILIHAPTRAQATGSDNDPATECKRRHDAGRHYLSPDRSRRPGACRLERQHTRQAGSRRSTRLLRARALVPLTSTNPGAAREPAACRRMPPLLRERERARCGTPAFRGRQRAAVSRSCLWGRTRHLLVRARRARRPVTRPGDHPSSGLFSSLLSKCQHLAVDLEGTQSFPG
jgi:RibD C-terminal domain